MRRIALLTLLALAGCIEADRMGTGLGDVPRDGRGEPILPAPNAGPVAAPKAGPVAVPGAAPGAAPTKLESCAHRRRCL